MEPGSGGQLLLGVDIHGTADMQARGKPASDEIGGGALNLFGQDDSALDREPGVFQSNMDSWLHIPSEGYCPSLGGQSESASVMNTKSYNKEQA